MPRLFVAMDLPKNIKTDIVSICEGLAGARWTHGSGLHITLAFIGEADAMTGAEIRKSLRRVESGPVILSLAELGFFPPKRKPSVLWVGVRADEALHRLQHKVERALLGLGVKPENRKFTPHVTIARFREVSEHAVGRFIAANNLFRTGQFTLDSFQLFSSVLAPDGAEYSIEEAYPLGESSLDC